MLCANGMWCLSNVVLQHNHDLSPGKTRFFRCNKNIDAAAKRRLKLNDIAGVRTNKNFNSLVVEKGGYENLPFGEKDCRNFIDKARELRLGKGGARALCDYFSRMQKQNNDFYYVMDMDDDCRLRNVFWANARSREAYEFFGDVITFDTTYLTNRYDMPFALFVGVNHHGQSILLGVGLISNEDTNTFVWLFNAWLGCMNNKAPSGIITDQDRAMKNAIELVFPETTRHRYCLWHIMRKLLEKFEDNAWLHGLYSERTFWVPTYLKNTFWTGMSTTQRSESMNSFFDGYVHSKTTLKEFVDQFDNGLRRMVEKETSFNFDSFHRMIPCSTPYPLEETFQDVYTNAKFKEVQKEFRKVLSCNNPYLRSEGAISTYQVIELSVVNRNMKEVPYCVCYNEEKVDVKCTCALFETRGILCSHAISVLLFKKVTMLPPRYYLTRWRKDIKREYTLVKSGAYAFDGNPDDERYDNMCKNFYELALLARESVDRYKKVMKNIDTMKEEFNEITPEPIHHSQHISVAAVSSTCNEFVQSNDTLVMRSNIVLSPIMVKRKGRSKSTRMVPTVEKEVKKSQQKKKAASDNNAKPKSGKKQVRNTLACLSYVFLAFVGNTFT
jgi:hypothetical protein